MSMISVCSLKKGTVSTCQFHRVDTFQKAGSSDTLHLILNCLTASKDSVLGGHAITESRKEVQHNLFSKELKCLREQ